MANLKEALEAALAKGRRAHRGQRKGQIAPGPRRLSVCDPCADALGGAPVVPTRLLGRHLEGYHGLSPAAARKHARGLP